MNQRHSLPLLLSVLAGFSTNMAMGQELSISDLSDSQASTVELSSPIQQVAHNALNESFNAQLASADSEIGSPTIQRLSPTPTILHIGDMPAERTPRIASASIGDASFPSLLTQDEVAGDSKVEVPSAPPVDLQSDPEGRPLSIPSNAATMPDDYYKKSSCNLGDPVYFVDRPTLRIGGWDQVGWHSQDNGLFNDYRRKINIHQSWGFIEKDFVTAGGTGIKFRGDLMYGIDSRRLQAFGNEPFGNPQDWDNSWDNGTYGWALPQLYTEVELQRATVRAGRFLSPFGFENAAPVENFFYSHTYAYTLMHPHTLSGVVAEGCLNDTTSVFAGGSNGWDTDFDEVGYTALGGFSKRLANGGLLTYGTSFGEFGARGTGYFHSIVYAVQASEKLQLAMQSDWLSAETSDDWGVTGYGIFRFSECLAAGTRLEYFETDPGVTKQQSALAWTSGINYRPHANVVIRPEVRVDYNGAAVAKGDVNLGLDFVLTY